MQRIPEFDAIRGLAAVAIIVFHLGPPWFTPLATAVDLFFVLSGYLITTIILKNQHKENFLRAFYARRALRIWPIYYLALLSLLALNYVWPIRYSTAALPYFLTYTPHIECYWGASEIPFIAPFLHTWTLAIEEQFYIIWPFLLILLGRKGVVPLALCFMGMSVTARTLGCYRWILLSQCDGLVLGGILAAVFVDYERHEVQSPRVRAAMILVCALAVALGGGGFYLNRLGGSWAALAASLKVLFTNLFYLGVIGLVASYSGHSSLRFLRTRTLCYLGQISYGLYLYHYIFIRGAEDLLHHYGRSWSWWFDVPLLLITFGIAALSWRFIEQPILSLKDRFQYGGSRSPNTRRIESETGLGGLSPAIEH